MIDATSYAAEALHETRHTGIARMMVSAIVSSGPMPRTKFSGRANTRATTSSTTRRSARLPRSPRSSSSTAGEFAMKSLDRRLKVIGLTPVA